MTNNVISRLESLNSLREIPRFELKWLESAIVAGCLIEHGDSLLLCRRAIEPRYGLWTLPAGFLENGESVEEGARRETREEACAEVEILQLFTIFSLTHINQVYMMFRARLHEPVFSPGEESLDVRLFEESEIPWKELAFPVMHQTLRHYFEDRSKGEFNTHIFFPPGGLTSA